MLRIVLHFFYALCQQLHTGPLPNICTVQYMNNGQDGMHEDNAHIQYDLTYIILQVKLLHYAICNSEN